MGGASSGRAESWSAGPGAINALIYMRGEAADYDRWQAKGAEGWGWQDVLPIFKRQEKNARLGGSPMHGDSGELLVNDVPEHDPAEHLWVKAAEEAGLPRNDDFNSGDQFGCGFFQAMIKDGERFGPADAFLDPVLDRPNLTLVTSALATRILIENGRAQGVEYFRHGKVETAPAGEIVLAGGTVNSPHLLFLSGIGPADALKQAGVSPVHDLPGVGQSMQDHVNVVVTYATDQKIGIGGLSEAEFGAAIDEWVAHRTGPMANPWSSTGGQAKSRPELEKPDLQIYGVASGNRDHARYFASRPGIGFYTILQRPKSTGTLTLRSPDPLTAPAIDPDYFSDPEGADLKTLIDGVRLSRRIAGTKALAHLDLREITPSAEAQTRRRDRRLRARPLPVDLPPDQHLPDGQRPARGGRPEIAEGARAGGPARLRRVGLPGRDRRQHLRDRLHGGRARRGIHDAIGHGPRGPKDDSREGKRWVRSPRTS